MRSEHESPKLPGSRLLRIATKYLDQSTAELVLIPIIADLQHDYRETTHGTVMREFILLRGYWSFWKTFGLHSFAFKGANMRVAKFVASWILAMVAGILIVGYLGVGIMIGWGINKESQSAMARFAGDRIEALIALVDCQDCRIEDRNHAVWALGQLRDKRALPVLYKYRTGNPCNHSRQICQYEISKAIRWTEGNSYMLPQIWRVMVRDDRRSAAKNNPS